MVAIGKDFINHVEAACFDALRNLGIRKRKKKIGTWDLHDDFKGWVGLNTETRYGDGTMTVNPFVGVRCDRIHRLIAEVKGTRYQPYSPPTISRFLGDLTEEAPLTGFEFATDGDVMVVANSLANCFATAGIPYAENNATLKALVNRIPLDCPWEDAGERLIAALYLVGDADGLDREIRERCEEGKSKHVNLGRFEHFVERLLKHIGNAA